MSDSTVWVHFSLTPVQGFIEGSRSVRDLWVSSRLLTKLVGKAIEAGVKEGGCPLYPTGNLSRHDSIPNQFVMLFDDKDKAEAAASAMEVAVRGKWEDLAGKVQTLLTEKWFGHGNWNDDWAEQVGRYFETHTVVLQFTNSVPWEKRWAELNRAIAANKAIRNFPGDHGRGRHKCTMMGELEQMGPTGEARGRKFWQDVSGDHIDGIWIRENERLCAVALVKRFLPSVSADYRKDIPDTATIAVKPWYDLAQSKVPDEWQNFHDRYKDLNEKLKGKVTLGRVVLAATLPQLQKEAGAPVDVCGLWNARQELRKAAREANLGAPPAYLAAIALDGDHIGDLLNQGQDKQYYNDLSEQLLQYAQEAENIIEAQGQPIYTGGDDLLALLPLKHFPKGEYDQGDKSVLEVALDLRRRYPHIATVSGGLTIFHYKYDLRSALRLTREAIQEAKRCGRNRIGIRVAKHSGGHLGFTLRWQNLARLSALYEWFAQGVSDRWMTRLATVQPAAEALDYEILANQVAYFVERTEGLKKSEKAQFVTDVRNLFEAVWNDQRSARDAQRNSSPHRPPTEPLEVAGLETFLSTVDTASFLTRGGR